MVAEMADSRKPRTPTRDSHDLSLSPRDITRDSLVANMLLSLDQMSFGQSPTDGSFRGSSRGENTYDHEYSSRPWTNGSNGSSASKSRGETSSTANRHWHQASYSSDIDSFAADNASKQSRRSPQSRGRRSNSGSNNFQNQLPRLNTTRETSHQKQSSTPRTGHTRGGRQSNKSSGSASVDMGHPQDQVSHRSAQRPSRPASFNHGSPPQPQSHKVSKSSPFRAQLPNSFSNIEYSAPTPTIPGGPREAAGLHIPPPPPDPVEHRTLDRKRSTSRSLRSSSGRSRRATVHQTAPALPQSSTMPALEQDSAPAPNVGYGKSKATNSTADSAATQPKERPGFFRRVFGSSKANTATANSSLPASQTSSSRFAPSPDRHLDQQQHAAQQLSAASKVSSAPPSRDTASSQSNHHPTLQKKTSFFRRRKKSIAEAAPPLPFADQVPPLPFVDSTSLASIPLNKDETSKASPASSLSQVMKPYLRGRGSSGAGLGGAGLGLTGVPVSDPLSDITNTPAAKADSHGETKSRGYMREFSPDYEPSPSALIRTVIPVASSELAEIEPTFTSAIDARNITQHDRKTFLDLEAGSDHDDASGAINNDQTTAAITKWDDGDATIRAKQKKPTFSMEDESRPAAQTALGPSRDGDRSASLASGSTESGYRTAPSAPPSVRVDETVESTGPEVLGTLESTTPSKALVEPEIIVGEPTEDDRQKAQRIYDGSEDFIQKDKAVAWMGEQGPIRQRTLQAYMELYDFTDQSILASLRQVCGRLVLRAETQQVDRILASFSKRWCVCNPNHGFKATDVIHMICYSIMLLNTDLHLADIEQKMTRSQFVKNTMTTITQAVRESAPDAFAHVRLSILPESKSAPTADSTRSMTEPTRSNRSSFRPPPRANTTSNDNEDCGPLVKAPFNGLFRAWQEQVENVLKSIYTSIRDERLPLFGSGPEKQLAPAPSQGSLSVMGMLKRSPSVLSKAPSETQLSVRGRIVDSSRTSTSRWTSKSRSRPGFGRTGFSSSRTSFDDGNSMWSPAISSAGWSKHSLGRTQGSISQDSFSSSMPRGGYQQSIGFANALSQAIIRDEDASGQEGGAPSILSADMSSTQLLEDESLELAGPPWVKEGMVMHKHHLDAHGKRAKERNWGEVFAVIQKGQISLFSFNASKSMRQKSRSRNGCKPNGPVGGGNWQDNAVNLGTFNLRLTLASALPSPGYSRSRPHVWALSLPTGAVHLFQVGSPDLIREFVNTANYWSARLSTHPLVGGISNIEYGWSGSIVNNALASAVNESSTSVQNVDGRSRPDSSATHGRKSSIASSSFRSSSFDQGSTSFPNNSGRGKLPADRFHIAEWAPPTQSIRPSNAPEMEQLESLSAYVRGIECELQSHNLLRSPMMLAFTPRGQNAGKAMANWERKSAYLLREIVKFRTYVDCLQQAETRKQEIYAERESTQHDARVEQTDADEVAGVNDEGDETLRP